MYKRQVDIGVLMFYNIGKVEDLATQNSIFNQADAERYIYTLKDYPLPLKFALPIFAWGVHFSDRKIKQIIPIETAMKMKHSKDFYLAKKDGYKANKNIYLNGFYFKKNDEIRMEETNAAIVNLSLIHIS